MDSCSRAIVRGQLFAGQLITTTIIRADNYLQGQLSFKYGEVKAFHGNWQALQLTTRMYRCALLAG